MMKRIAGSVLVALTLVSSAAGCDLDGLRGKLDARSEERADGPAPRDGRLDNVGTGKKARSAPADAPSGQRPKDIDYLEDTSDVVRLFKDKVGCNPCRALKLIFYPARVMSEFQDPKSPLNADAYMLEGATVREPSPVMFFGEKPTLDSMRDNTFDLERDVELAKVPRMVASAPALVKIDDGVVSHVVVSRALPFTKDVELWVFVSGPRRHGWVVFAPDGAVKEVHE